MIYKSIDEMPMCKFIDLACGDVDAVAHGRKVHGRQELEEAAARLKRAYYAIVNARQAKGDLKAEEVLLNTRMKLYCLGHVANLSGMGLPGEAVSAMGNIGYGCTAENLGNRLVAARAELSFMLARWEQRAKVGNGPVLNDAGRVRDGFTRERAFLMTYHKMFFDIRRMSAGEYANILAQTDKEIQSRLELAKKKR